MPSRGGSQLNRELFTNSPQGSAVGHHDSMSLSPPPLSRQLFSSSSDGGESDRESAGSLEDMDLDTPASHSRANTPRKYKSLREHFGNTEYDAAINDAPYTPRIIPSETFIHQGNGHPDEHWYTSNKDIAQRVYGGPGNSASTYITLRDLTMLDLSNVQNVIKLDKLAEKLHPDKRPSIFNDVIPDLSATSDYPALAVCADKHVYRRSTVEADTKMMKYFTNQHYQELRFQGFHGFVWPQEAVDKERGHHQEFYFFKPALTNGYIKVASQPGGTRTRTRPHRKRPSTNKRPRTARKTRHRTPRRRRATRRR